GFLVLMEDQAEETILSENKLSRETRILTALYRNARAQWNYRLGHPSRWSSFWLNSGAHVPLVLHSEGQALGFVATEDGVPSISQRRSADRFLRQYPNGKVIFLFEGMRGAQVLDERSLICSISTLI